MSLDKKLIATIAQSSDLFSRSIKDVDESFFKGPYVNIYKLLAAYHKKHRKIPSFDIIEEQLFKSRNKIFGEDIDADAFILQLRAETTLAEPSDYEFLVDDIKKRKGYDTISNILPEAILAAKSDDLETAANLLISAGNSMRVTLASEQMNRTSNHDYVDTVLESYSDAKEHPDKIWGFKTGFSKLDKATYGVDRGEMWLISARPGNGKSMFLLSVATNMFKAGHNILYASLEMPAKQMWQRAVACYSGKEINKIKEGTLSEEEEREFKKEMQEFKESSSRFEILDAPKVTPGSLAAELDQMIEKHRPDVLFVDYLGIMSADESGLQDNLAQASVVEGLRSLARVRNIGIFTAAQLNRPEKGKKKAAGLDRLARSDTLGATVDVALAVEEFDVEEEMTKLSDRVKIFVIKNRKGPFPISLEAKKDFSRGRFLEWDTTAGWSGTAITDVSKVLSENPLLK